MATNGSDKTLVDRIKDNIKDKQLIQYTALAALIGGAVKIGWDYYQDLRKEKQNYGKQSP